MSNIFSDIFEAIRYLRQEKGATEVKILTYVEERLGKGVNLKSCLKIMKALNRLVDDGLLVRKGKRYMLPFPPPASGNDNGNEGGHGNGMEEDEDEDDEDDDDEEEEEEEEDDDDEDDEDEEDEGDEDDDDDDDCMKNGENNSNGKGKEKSNGNGKSKPESRGNAGGNEGGQSKNQCPMDEDLPPRRYDSDWDQKHIAYKLKKYVKTELNPMQSSFGRSKKQRQKYRRNQYYDEIFDQESRSSSASRGNSYTMMELGLPESEGDAQLNNRNFSFSCDLPDFTNCRYRSPNGSPPPNTPGVHVERKESCCSDVAAKIKEDAEKAEPEAKGEMKMIKREPETSAYSLTRGRERQGKRREREGDEEKGKMEKVSRRDVSLDNSENMKASSLCLYCKKKKLSGYDACCYP